MLMLEEKLDEVRKNNQPPARYAPKGIHGIETIDVMEYCAEKFDSKQAVSVAQIVKYFSRYNDKNGYEDLDKGVDYLKRLIGEWK